MKPEDIMGKLNEIVKRRFPIYRKMEFCGCICNKYYFNVWFRNDPEGPSQLYHITRDLMSQNAEIRPISEFEKKKIKEDYNESFDFFTRMCDAVNSDREDDF